MKTENLKMKNEKLRCPLRGLIIIIAKRYHHYSLFIIHYSLPFDSPVFYKQHLAAGAPGDPLVLAAGDQGLSAADAV